MPLLIALVILFFSPLLFLLLNRAGVQVIVQWLLAVFLAVGVWLLLWFLSSRLPLEIPIVWWDQLGVLAFWDAPFTLLVDQFSWPFGFALAAVGAATMVTSIIREGIEDWRNTVSILVLLSLGLVGVFAGNLVTLMAGWVALDAFSAFILLRRMKQGGQQIVTELAIRFIGLMFLFLTLLLAWSQGIPDAFDNVFGLNTIFLLLAVGVRLGVLPLQVYFFVEPVTQRGLGTVLRMAFLASSLALLPRLASEGLDGLWLSVLLVMVWFAGVYGVFNWLQADDEISGRLFWRMGIASLVMAAAMLGQATASISWGVSLILTGGVLFLFSFRQRWGQVLVLMTGLLSFGLPYLPSWPSVALYQQSSWLIFVGFGAIQIVLFIGVGKHALRKDNTPRRYVLGEWVIYLLGLAILPFSLLLFGLRFVYTDLTVSWGGWQAAVLLVVGLLLWRRVNWQSDAVLQAAQPVVAFFSLRWLYRYLWRGYQAVGVLVAFLSRLLEGEGGFLWAMFLMAVLFLALLQGVAN